MRVVVARVGRALGVRGDLLVEPRTDEPERRLAPGCEVLIADTDNVLVVESARPHGNRLALHFAGVDDRDAAHVLTGTLLEIERAPDERPEGPEEYYDDMLVGLDVHAESGEYVGVVTDVLHLPAQDVLAVRSSPDGPETLVPFVGEIVPVVDVESGRIVIRPPDGLIERGPDA